MWFHTYTFGLFLPVVFLLYQVLPLRGRQWMLVAASYLFYCWDTPVYGLLLLLSTLLDFSVGCLIEDAPHPARRKLLLACSLSANILLLAFFKYADFLGANLCGLGRLFGFDTAWTPYHFILPAGISFYTFQTMSYAIQVYRRQLKAERDFLTFALYVSFFPQLVAGPIERATNLLHQLRIFHRVTAEDIAVGLQRIVLGLFLKLVLADRFAILANLVYDNPGHYPTFTVWTGVFCFFGQVYMDFAGYASIAIGSARLFGVRLTENFNNPLAARSVADFWNRWHITLTSWFRDYLFTPLGGFRKGGVRAAINGCLVLLICGLWHGASWHFVAWGAYHAVFLTLYYVWRYWAKSAGLERNRSTEGFSVLLLAYVLITLIIGTVGTVLFRATDLSVAGQVFRAMLGVHAGAGKPVEWYTWIYATLFWGLIAVEFSQAYLGGRKRVQESPAWMRAIGYSVLAIAALLCAVNLQTPYIYFQF